ncbi:MAG: prepilin-type N-terminal cleavage/methylation domain-containing protein [Sulfuritalea sp.]|jgi:prepilin-type N-terminal cleavage/methylation domain-containing protein|nr:prepilin-type N-terminal cleavage/methylation domain-containing protein [Sulfuritalea sp.]
MMTGQRGFTMVKLTVTMVIIGILAVVDSRRSRMVGRPAS